jgi:hypothetical protein
MSWGGCHADENHGEKDREGGKEPFGVLAKVRPKKGQNSCGPGRWLGRKNEMRLGKTGIAGV